MCTGLTSNISPRRNTIATQETISAWFWMTNSWLITGGFLFVFFRIPISERFGATFALHGVMAIASYQIQEYSDPLTKGRLKLPRFLQATEATYD